jgi:hypothetical protein
MTKQPSEIGVVLEPCPTPWCDSLYGGPYRYERATGANGVRCPTCSVTTPYFVTEAEAVAAWNTRR